MEYQIRAKRSVYVGKVFKVEQVDVTLPDGKPAIYDLVVHPGSVTIIPVDDQGLMYFVRQYRIGAGRMLLELPAGTMEENEDPLECAKREVREETGMSGELIEVGDLFLAPGYTSEHMTLYLATGLYPAKLDGDEDEFLKVVTIPVKEVYKMIELKQVNDGKTLAALILALPFLKKYMD